MNIEKKKKFILNAIDYYKTDKIGKTQYYNISSLPIIFDMYKLDHLFYFIAPLSNFEISKNDIDKILIEFNYYT